MKAFLCAAIAITAAYWAGSAYLLVATTPAHKQAVVYTSTYDYQYGQRQKIDACAKTTIELAASLGLSKAEASAVFNDCIVNSGVMI